MKRLFTLILILFCFAEVKGQIMWERIEKDTVTYLDTYRKILAQDSLIYLHGTDSRSYAPPYPVFYSCYNLNGKLKWRKVGRKPTYYWGHGDFIIDSDSYLATTRSDGNTFKFFFQKINRLTGDTLPSSVFVIPYSLKRIPHGFMIKEPNGEYMIGGASLTTPEFAKLNSSGKPVWTKFHNWYNQTTYTLLDGPGGFLRKCNGNYVMCYGRWMEVNNASASHPFFVEFKPNGDTLRTRTFVLEHPQFFENIVSANLTQTKNGGFLYAGSIDTIINQGSGFDAKYFVSNIDSQFKLQWIYINKGALKDYIILKVAELADGSFALLSRSDLNQHYAVIKIDNAGKYMSHFTFASPVCGGRQMLWDWKVLPDGTAIVAGKCNKNGYSYVARIAGVGIPATPPTCTTLTPGEPESLYPVLPNLDLIVPELPEKPLPADLLIYDLTGRIIKKLVVMENDISKLNIDLEGTSNGVYIYKLITQEGIVTTRKVLFYR